MICPSITFRIPVPAALKRRLLFQLYSSTAPACHGVDKPQRRFQSDCKCKASTGCINKRRWSQIPKSNLAINGVGGRQYGPGKVSLIFHLHYPSALCRNSMARGRDFGAFPHSRIPQPCLPLCTPPLAPLYFRDPGSLANMIPSRAYAV